MSDPAIAQFVTIWLIVNVTALLVLAVLSYVSSRLALGGLAFLDRWMQTNRHQGCHVVTGDARQPDDAMR